MNGDDTSWTTPHGHLMDEFGRQTMIMSYIDGGGRRKTVHLINGFRRRTIKNIKMWTEVNWWTDGQKSVRIDLVKTVIECYFLLTNFYSHGHPF